MQSRCFLATAATHPSSMLCLHLIAPGSLSPKLPRTPPFPWSPQRCWGQPWWFCMSPFLGLGAEMSSGCGHRCCWTFLCPQLCPALMLGLEQGCCRAPTPSPCPLAHTSSLLGPVVSAALCPLQPPCTDTNPPSGLCFVPIAACLGYPGSGAGVPRTPWGALPAMGPCGAACALPACPPSSSPHIQPRRHTATSPALFLLGPGSGWSSADPAPPAAPKPCRDPAAWGPLPSRHPFARIRPPLLPACPQTVGPSTGAERGRGGRKDKKPSFVLSEENWGFCFPGNRAVKAKPGGCRCRTKPAVSLSHSPGRSNRLPRPGIWWAGQVPAAGQGALRAPALSHCPRCSLKPFLGAGLGNHRSGTISAPQRAKWLKGRSPAQGDASPHLRGAEGWWSHMPPSTAWCRGGTGFLTGCRAPLPGAGLAGLYWDQFEPYKPPKAQCFGGDPSKGWLGTSITPEPPGFREEPSKPQVPAPKRSARQCRTADA